VILELVALVCSGLFAGAAVYVALVEHPARLECGTPLALAEFRPSYRRASVLQAALAAIGCLAAVGGGALGRGARWGRLHAVRSAAGVVAFLLLAVDLVLAR
jgi:hypothetical protein